MAQPLSAPRREPVKASVKASANLSILRLVPDHQELELPDVEAHITGTVWKVEVEVGDSVEEGDAVVILESMKMEMPVEAEDPGVVKEILCSEGQSVSEGDTLVVLE
jgi:acetyl-CoA carboxylase biotin carboxyl carrier protein